MFRNSKRLLMTISGFQKKDYLQIVFSSVSFYLKEYQVSPVSAVAVLRSPDP